MATTQARYTTWYTAQYPALNQFQKTTYAQVRGGSPAAEALVYFSNAIPARVNVVRATLRLRTRAVAGTGTHSLTVQAVAKGLNFWAATWNTRPTAMVGPAVTVTKTGALAAGTVWEFDLTALAQLVADGQPFYGLKVTSSVAEPVYIQTVLGAMPALDVVTTTKPLAPSSLSPSGGGVSGAQRPVLRWDHTDNVGDDVLAAVQVQTSTSAAFSAVAWDSGVVASTTPSLDLSATSFPAPAAGAVVWWRVRNRDSSGVWSEWSLPTSWSYQPLPTLTLTNPSGATLGDPTPPLTWTYASPVGSAQSRFRVGVYRVDGSTTTLHEASGTLVSGATSWTPTKPMGPVGAAYKIVLDAWDSRTDRVAVPGVPTYASTYRTVTMSTGAQAAPTNLRLTDGYPMPWVTLTWDRPEVPDRWVIHRDDGHLAAYDGPALRVGSSSTYTITDRLVPVGSHTWKVYAVVNGVSSPALAATAHHDHVGTWLVDLDTYEHVCLQNDTEHDLHLVEVSTVHEVLNAPDVVILTDALRGYEGRLAGDLVDVLGMPASENAANWRARLLKFRANPGGRYRLVIEDIGIEVQIRGVDVAGNPDRPGQRWRAAVEVYQTGNYVTNSIGG